MPFARITCGFRMRRTKAKKHTKLNRFSRIGGLHSFQAYLHNHAYVLFFSLGRLIRTPVTSAMTILVLAIAIALAGSFYILVINVQQLTGNLESSNEISLFLKDRVTEKQGRKIAAQLAKNKKIHEINFITREQAMAEFKAYSGFGEALKVLDKNPLPNVVQILPKNSLANQHEIQRLIAEMQKIPEVDFAQIDMQWVQRLHSMLQVTKRVILILSLLLALAVIFITANTIRLELQNRREEVIIAQLLGATLVFIQRPFLYSGFWYGFVAGLLAWIIITMMLFALQQPVYRLSFLYDSNFSIQFLSFKDSIGLIFLSASLGVIGAWIVLCFQLQQLQPE